MQPTHQASSVAANFATPVVIPPPLKRRLDLYISQCPWEISGFGTVELKGGAFVATNLFLLDQVVTAGSTVIDPMATAMFLARAQQEGIDPAALRLWWHSHAGHQVYWSPTDEATIRNVFSHVPWFVSVVGNHAGAYLARVDTAPSDSVPIRLTHTAPLLTALPNEREIRKVRAEIKKRVKLKQGGATNGGLVAPKRRVPRVRAARPTSVVKKP